jgi:hypothetical protein
MPSRKDATVEELRTAREGLRGAVRTATTDPKELARKQRLWQALFLVISAVFALVARRFAAKSWAILTGEQPPVRKT